MGFVRFEGHEGVLGVEWVEGFEGAEGLRGLGVIRGLRELRGLRVLRGLRGPVLFSYSRSRYDREHNWMNGHI